MNLYIEYVVLDNLVVDYFILRMISLFFKIKINKLNIIFFCLVGIVSAFFLPYIMHIKYLSLLYKFIISIIMVMVIRKFSNFKIFIKYYLTFLVSTFMMGGIIYAILMLFGIKYTSSSIVLYSFELPMSVLIIVSFLCFWFVKKVVKLLQYQLNVSNYLYSIKIEDGEHSAEGVGFYDTGNNVIIDGEGVNIISINLFMKLYKDFPIEKIVFRNVSNKVLKNVEYINIEGLSNNEKYLSFVIDKICVDKKEFNNVRVAVTLKNFENFDCILHNNLIGG